MDWCVAAVDAEFALSAPLHGLLDALGARKLDESFDEHGLHLRLRLPASSFDALADRLRDLSRGAARLRRLETPDA